MSAAAPSTLQRAMTWLVVILAAVLIGWGGLQYGWSPAIHDRFWSDISDRVHGPMTFRFLLQPSMALLAAVPDGIQDARVRHRGHLRGGLISIARVALLGISMDVIYQFKVFDRFYPVEALMMALLLAVIPYFVLRWMIGLVARGWFPAAVERETERRP